MMLMDFWSEVWVNFSSILEQPVIFTLTPHPPRTTFIKCVECKQESDQSPPHSPCLHLAVYPLYQCNNKALSIQLFQ